MRAAIPRVSERRVYALLRVARCRLRRRVIADRPRYRRLEKVLSSFLAPDVLIIDDFGLRRLSNQQSSDFYEVIIERHRRTSTIFTSNWTIEEWIPLFADPILAQSALDRLAHNAYQVVIEGDSYRSRQRPGERQVTAPKSRKRGRS